MPILKKPVSQHHLNVRAVLWGLVRAGRGAVDDRMAQA